MKREAQNIVNQSSAIARPRCCGRFAPLIAFAFLALPTRAHASLFHGETLDAIANGISWVVLIIAPIIGIVAFWLVHILPEKIAHKKMHPQTRAIQCLCLLSLCFGGLLWPIAWLWATPSRFCTRWLTVPMWMNRSATDMRRSLSMKRRR